MAAMPASPPPPEATFEVVLAFFKSLANESRLRLVGLLLKRPHNVKELAVELRLKEPTVCHHLACLTDAGLVQMSAKGNAHYYSLREQELRRLSRTIFGRRRAIASAAPEPKDANSRVLSNYLAGEALKTIPASRRKRVVVLKWLAEKFVTGRRYREAEVNELIQRHYWDSATLRRELIGYRMLNRSRGIYWRRPEADWLSA
jgi:DNA-binding transcriptional ArsR family regulator